MSIQEVVNTPGTKIVDVRTREEYMGGNVVDSINIPLQELPQRVGELKTYDGNIVLCCASGGRSGIAVDLLKGQGFNNVYNGGGWTDVNFLKNN